MNSTRPIDGAKILTLRMHAHMNLTRIIPIKKPLVKRTLRLISTLGFLALAAGCVPNVSWLPDSSGFVFTTAQGALVHYDVLKDTRRVLVADTGTNTIWPAISPDGKRIALARLNMDKAQPNTLQIIFYDLEGKELLRSRELDWHGVDFDKQRSREAQTQLYWAPRGDKLLVFGNGTTGIYEPGADRVVKQWKGTLPLVYGNTPVRPDGRGFLLGKLRPERHEVNEMVFVGWDGREKKIDLQTEKLKKLESDPVRDMLTWPVLFRSSWEGEAALVTWTRLRIRIDTTKQVVTYAKHPDNDDNQKNLRDQLHDQYVFPDGVTRIAVRYLEQKDAGLPQFRVEVSGADPAKSRTLVARTAVCVLSPAPNKQWVAVRCGGTPETPKNSDQDLIWVVNHKGKVVAEIDLTEKGPGR